MRFFRTGKKLFSNPATATRVPAAHSTVTGPPALTLYRKVSPASLPVVSSWSLPHPQTPADTSGYQTRKVRRGALLSGQTGRILTFKLHPAQLTAKPTNLTRTTPQRIAAIRLTAQHSSAPRSVLNSVSAHSFHTPLLTSVENSAGLLVMLQKH